MPVKQKYSEHVIDIIEMEDIQTESDCNSEDSDTQHLGTLPDLNGTIENVSLDEATISLCDRLTPIYSMIARLVLSHGVPIRIQATLSRIRRIKTLLTTIECIIRAEQTLSEQS